METPIDPDELEVGSSVVCSAVLLIKTADVEGAWVLGVALDCRFAAVVPTVEKS